MSSPARDSYRSGRTLASGIPTFMCSTGCSRAVRTAPTARITITGWRITSSALRPQNQDRLESKERRRKVKAAEPYEDRRAGEKDRTPCGGHCARHGLRDQIVIKLLPKAAHGEEGV